MENLLNRLQGFFSGENIKALSVKVYEWFEITLSTLFGKIPYEPIKDLFINPWFWFILIFIVILIIILRRR